MADGEIVIKTEIDDTGLNTGLKKVQTQVNTAGAKIDKTINKSAKNATAQSKKVQTATKTLGDKLRGLGGEMKSCGIMGGNLMDSVGGLIDKGGAWGAVIGAEVAALKGLGFAINECTEYYKVQQKAEATLQAASLNNPYLNDEGVNNLKRFASALQETSNYGDETTIKLMTQLASAGRTEAEIKKIISASADLASSGLMSYESAVQQLNATYSGMAGTLSRQVGAVRELTEEQLKNGEAVDLVAQKYKGLAGASLDAKTQADNATGDMYEAVGKWTKPLKDAIDTLRLSLTNAITGALNAGDDALEGWKTDRAWKTYFKKLEKEIKKGEIDLETELATEVADFSDAQIGYAIRYITKLGDKATKTQTKVLAQMKAEAKDREAELEKELQAQSDKDFIGGLSKEKLDEYIKAGEEFEARYKKATEAWHNAIRTGASESLKNLLQEENTKAKHQAELYRGLATLAKERMDALNKEADEARKKLIAESDTELKQSLENAKNTAKAKGEELTKQEELNVRIQNYTALLSKANGLLDENSNAATTRMKTIEKLRKEINAQTDSETNLAEAMKRAQELIGTINSKVNKSISNELEAMLIEYKNISAKLEAMSEATLEAFNKKSGSNYTKQGLKNLLDEGEVALEKQKAEAIANIQKTASEAHATRLKELNEAESFYRNESILGAQEQAEALNAIDEARTAENRKFLEQQAQDRNELMGQIADNITTTVNGTTEVMNGLGELAIGVIESEADAQMSKLNKQYKEGLISEQEYEDKKEEIQKKAAEREYQVKMFEWSNNILQASASLAVGIMKCFEQQGILGTVSAALMASLGAVQLGNVIANKPQKPSFAKGGIVGGSSYYGDNISANVNSGEMILTRAQQKTLWDTANGGGGGGNIIVNNSQSHFVQTRQKRDEVTGDTYIDIIDKHINDTFKNGGYDEGYNGMMSNREGTKYY